MILKYSKPKGIPYIELDEHNRLIFSVSTEAPQGFRYLCFNGCAVSTININGSKAKNRKMVDISSVVNFTTTMNFTKVPKLAKRTALTPLVLGYLKKTFKDLIDDEGHFPRECLPTLGKILERVSGKDEDEWDDDPTATESYDEEEE
jgi:hypothetical protein